MTVLNLLVFGRGDLRHRTAIPGLFHLLHIEGIGQPYQTQKFGNSQARRYARVAETSNGGHL